MSSGTRARVRLGPAHLPLAGRPTPDAARLSPTERNPNDGGFHEVTRVRPVPPRRAYWLGRIICADGMRDPVYERGLSDVSVRE